MNYNIRGENIEVTPAIREHVEKKISKLERYFNETPDANVHVNLKVYPDKNTKTEVTIPMPNLVLRAEERNTDMYAAIDLIVDKLERQIRKHKTRVNRKMREKGSPKEFFAAQEDLGNVAPNGVAEPEVDELEDDTEVVRTKNFNLKPMDSEEAILQMNMLGHTFFIFTDAETNATNIVYKRRDGKYGLIETH
ncbi:ribosome-associated translation inhibitor RaiA [Rossellomorea marisflavi]|uniref:Ribosome hibernation promoting factor n=1 Tax=Rossellomorea marisflavi TaxID=189381 RepID=A0A5D4S6C4_9BACI|nr:ribosome-associated translation inhibitor RaiA [Bacillus sp. JRC01]QHA38587.1 ribosome-associated translation inhibitor RaiA [Rossellomorea marisflavi]TYO69872.1 ribosome-associated translation inhibitor RaiA [Rossellomorea marisflavi]TYS57302.1 ribosome-associated translation inhibitor RaiA [Rossellomorea marisflavi]UKS67640.1 ribosome-associated translation inhibitor RaiA [Rossellomorea marisflavi]